jgi:hypothetical protein
MLRLSSNNGWSWHKLWNLKKLQIVKYTSIFLSNLNFFLVWKIKFFHLKYSFCCLFCHLLDSTAWDSCTTCPTLAMPLHEDLICMRSFKKWCVDILQITCQLLSSFCMDHTLSLHIEVHLLTHMWTVYIIFSEGT